MKSRRRNKTKAAPRQSSPDGRRALLPCLLLLGGLCWASGRQEPTAAQRAETIPLEVLPFVPDYEPTEQVDAPPQPQLFHPLLQDDEPSAEPPPYEPRLEVRISGPVDSLVGDLVELHAESTATVTNFAWSIQPPVRSLLIMEEGSKAVFSNRQAGNYLVIVSAANALGETAHATMGFTLRPAPPENPLTVESLADAQPPPDVRDLVRRWVAEVVSDNKLGEASAVAGSLRQTANLLATNSLDLGSDGDPLHEVEKAAEIAMGPEHFPKWATFFSRVRDLLYPLNVRGYVQSPTDYANTFNNLAGELEAIAAGR